MNAHWEKFIHLFERQEMNVKATLRAEGELSKTMFLIEKSSLRTWVNKNGVEITTQFF